MGSLADSLFEKPPFNHDSAELRPESVTLNQRLADEITSHYFESKGALLQRANLPYKKDNPLLPGMDNVDIIEHEKKGFASRFELLKWAGGVAAASKFGPNCMPKEVAPAALLEWKKKTGEQHIVFGSQSHSEMIKELKLKYVATCIGGMAAGWAASHAIDVLLFPKDQYLEGTLMGDAAGIGLAIVVPGWRQKALFVAGTHLMGKSVDHFWQPLYPTRK